MTINEESFKAWEQDHIEFLTSREMGEWLHRRDINAKRSERPQGEWIEKEEPFGWSDISVAECSVCNHSWTLGELSIEEVKEDFKFCPNCGARMEDKK